MSEYNVWWIDDDKSREKDASLLGNHVLELNVKFSGPDDAVDLLNSDSELPSFDLVLIDWKLNEDGEFLGKGLTMAGKIREEFSGVPIYGFSDAIDDLRAATTQDQFEATYDASELKSEEGARKIKNDIDSYIAINEAKGEDLQALVDVLNAPSQSNEDLQSIIPREYSNGLQNDPELVGGGTLDFAGWVRNRFLNTPGPLWSDRWLATELGLEEDALDEYVEELNDAIDETATYTGVFSHRCDRRWWATSAIDAVVSLAEAQDVPIGDLTMVGEEVLNETEGTAYCRVCNKSYPDILAAGREGENAKFPVHLSCSHIHHSREGAFEDYRVADQL